MKHLPPGAMQALFAPLLDQTRKAWSSSVRGSSGALAAGSSAAIGSASGAKPVNIPTRKTLLYENCRLLVSATGQRVVGQGCITLLHISSDQLDLVRYNANRVAAGKNARKAVPPVLRCCATPSSPLQVGCCC